LVPIRHLRALEILALVGTLEGLSYFVAAIAAVGVDAFCCVAVPLGTAFLIVDVLTYQAVRKTFPNGALTRSGAKFTAKVALLANGVPILVSAVALMAGLTLSTQYPPWLRYLTPCEFVFGAVAIALIYHPFNVIGLILGTIGIIAARQPRIAKPNRAAS